MLIIKIRKSEYEFAIKGMRKYLKTVSNKASKFFKYIKTFRITETKEYFQIDIEGKDLYVEKYDHELFIKSRKKDDSGCLIEYFNPIIEILEGGD